MNGTIAAFLQAINAAVTPVVLIAACASLILGVNSKHTDLSSQLRSAASEFRNSATTQARLSQIHDEIAIFYRRFLLTWFALGSLYCAAGCFIATTLLILLTQRRLLSFENGTLTFFVFGIVLMLTASTLEVIEVAFSSLTLKIELRDVLSAHSDRKEG